MNQSVIVNMIVYVFDNHMSMLLLQQSSFSIIWNLIVKLHLMWYMNHKIRDWFGLLLSGYSFIKTFVVVLDSDREYA